MQEEKVKEQELEKLHGGMWATPYMTIVKEKLEDRIIKRVDKMLLVRCGLCRGSGESPWEISVCRACRGKGVFWIEEPIKVCWLCHGTGQQPATRFKVDCKMCGGKGVIKPPVGVTCPLCHGTGKAPGTSKSCGMCKGNGVIPEEPTPYPEMPKLVQKRRVRDRKPVILE